MILQTHALTRPLIVLVAAASLLLIADQSSAQQASRNGNSRVSTIGDISQSKLRARVFNSFGLRLGPGGLFGDAEVFGSFSQPRIFTFAIPNYGNSGFDFANSSYNDYLDFIASSYRLADRNVYKDFFLAQNEFTVTNNIPFFFGFPELSNKFNQLQTLGPDFFAVAFPDDNPLTLFSDLSDEAFKRIHENDFAANGGFLPFLDDPVIPEPILPEPTPDPTLPGDDGPVFNPLPGGPIIPISSGLTAPIAASSLSAPAVSASVVPEPATLALMSMGVGLLLRRARRRS